MPITPEERRRKLVGVTRPERTSDIGFQTCVPERHLQYPYRGTLRRTVPS